MNVGCRGGVQEGGRKGGIVSAAGEENRSSEGFLALSKKTCDGLISESQTQILYEMLQIRFKAIYFFIE